MNHYDARQIEAGPRKGLWLYTSYNKRCGTVPVGHCAGDCPGHATAEDAREHFRQWQINTARFSPGPADPECLHRCHVPGCGQYTAGYAQVRHGGPFWLCDAHRDPVALASVVPSVGRIESSL